VELKHWIFVAMSIIAIPALAALGLRHRWGERLLVAGALLSTSYLVDINFISMEWYRGDTRGFEFGVTDWMVIALAITMLGSRRWAGRRPRVPPLWLPLTLYLAIAAASVLAAYVPVYAGFGLFKLLRAVAVYWVAYNWLRSEDDLRFVLLVLVAMVGIQFLLVLGQRAGGLYRAVGSTPHPNTLAVYVNFMNMIFLAVLMSGRLRFPASAVVWTGFSMGTLIVLATFSRGALATMALGYGLVVSLSLLDRARPRKLVMVGIMALAALPLVVKTAPSVIHRFQTAPVESGLSRQQANAAALEMARNHFLGVGLNNYSHVVNNTAYSRFVPLEADRGIVHNVYLLQASELGWVGLAAFLLVVAGFFWRAGRFLARRTDDLASAVAIGIFVGMVALWAQSLLEWLFRQTYVTIQFFLLAGFLCALPRVSSAIRRARHRRAALIALIARRRRPVLPASRPLPVPLR
jgi:O-antigen ligase